MVTHLDELTDRDLTTLAEVVGSELEELRSDLHRRPWSIHDLLSEQAVFDTVMERKDHPSAAVSPFLLFATLVHRAATGLRDATFVNDWSGPRSRLPVFDVAPLQEFLTDTGRTLFLAKLLASFAQPQPAPVPANPFDLNELALWVDQVTPEDRSILLRRLGDLALFLSGVFPDRTGSKPMMPTVAQRLGRTVDMTSDQILELCDYAQLSPGLAAYESLGSRWYDAHASEGGSPVVADVANRFRAARRVLNHIADTFLYQLSPGWNPLSAA